MHLRSFCRKHPVAEAALLGLFPALLALINDSWTFIPPPQGNIDNWDYRGFFLDLSGSIDAFWPQYPLSRLPWILLGNGVYSLSDAGTANLLLRLLLFYTSVFSLFATVLVLWKNRTAATIAALLLATHTHFLAAIRWDYVDGPGLTVTLLTLACLTLARDAKWWPLLLFAGGFCAQVMLSIHLFLAILLPALALFYAGTHLPEHKPKRIAAGLPFIAAGALAAFIVFAIACYHLTGDWNYLEPQLTVAKVGGQSATPVSLTDRVWLNYALVGVLVAVVLVALGLRNRQNEPLWLAAVAGAQLLLVAFLFVAVTQFSAITAPPLMYTFYASYLVPLVFIAIGAALALSLKDVMSVRAGFIVVCLLLVLAPIAASGLRLEGSTDHATLLWLACALAAALVALAIVRHHPALVGLAILGLVVVNTSGMSDVFLSSGEKQLLRRDYDLVSEINDFVAPYNDRQQVVFWYDEKEPTFYVARGVSSLHFWSARLVSESFPSLALGTNPETTFGIGTTIALITSKPDAISQANASLAKRGFVADVAAQRTFQRSSGDVTVYVLRTGFPGRLTTEPLALRDLEGGDVTQNADGSLTLATQPVPYQYAGLLTVPTALQEKYGDLRVLVKVRAEFQPGPVAFSLLKSDRSVLLDSQLYPTKSAKGGTEVLLTAPRLSDVLGVIVQTGDKPVASKVRLLSIELLLYSQAP